MSNGIDSRVGTGSLIFACVWSIGIAYLAVALWPAIPQFASLFRGFGAEVPAITSTVITFRIPLLSLLTLSVLAQLGLLIALLKTRAPQERRVHRLMAVLNSIVLVVIGVALYLPIFALGAVV